MASQALSKGMSQVSSQRSSISSRTIDRTTSSDAAASNRFASLGSIAKSTPRHAATGVYQRRVLSGHSARRSIIRVGEVGGTHSGTQGFVHYTAEGLRGVVTEYPSGSNFSNKAS